MFIAVLLHLPPRLQPCSELGGDGRLLDLVSWPHSGRTLPGHRAWLHVVVDWLCHLLSCVDWRHQLTSHGVDDGRHVTRRLVAGPTTRFVLGFNDVCHQCHAPADQSTWAG